MIRMLLLMLWFPMMAAAQDMPQPLSDTVSDFANLLMPDQEAQLTQMLQAARAETGVQIAVVTMDRTASYGGSGQGIETYAKNLFNSWGVGDAKRNDGILLLVAKDDRAMRIALGDGFDPVYDGLAQRVIDSEMVPKFRNGQYADGILRGSQSVIDRLARPFGSNQTPAAVAEPSRLPGILLFGIGGIAILLMAFRRQIGDVLTRFRVCPSCGQRGLTRSRVPETGWTGTQITRCSYCNHESRKQYSILRGGSSGSGSGGFGGGHSSGGGASGRW